MIPVLLGVSFVVFLLMYISPGDPAKMILGEMAEPEEQDVPDIVEPGEEALERGYHKKAYRSLRDIKEKAAGLLASLEDTGFGL